MKEFSELLQAAADSLRLGYFSRAVEEFGEILEADPENPEGAAGVYISGYWNNRSDLFTSSEEGLKQGSLLLREWEEFDRIADSRGYYGLAAYRAAMQFVLSKAAGHYKTAFEKEGGQSPDRNVLITLGQLLMRTGDTENAADIFQYARRLNSGDAKVLFLLGECLLASENPALADRGLSFYRDGFFINPQALDPGYISSPHISSVFSHLWEKYSEKPEYVLEWMPAWLSAEYFRSGWRKLSGDEVKSLIKEAKRLEPDLNRGHEKFLFKIRARLAFYYITLIHHFTYTEKNPDLAADLEEMLRDLDSELYSVLRTRSRAE